MKCFNHVDVDAVAICRSCGKAICPDCYVDVGNGIACKGPCEERTTGLNLLIDHNIDAAKRYGIGKKPIFSKIAANFFIFGLILLAFSMLFGKLQIVEKHVGFVIMIGLASLLIAAIFFTINHFFGSPKAKKTEAS